MQKRLNRSRCRLEEDSNGRRSADDLGRPVYHTERLLLLSTTRCTRSSASRGSICDSRCLLNRCMAFCVPPCKLDQQRWRFHAWAGGGHRPLQIVARPPNLAVLLTHCGQLMLGKITIKFVATRCQILTIKCTKFDCRWDSAADPAGGASIAPQTPQLYLRLGCFYFFSFSVLEFLVVVSVR